MRTQAPLSALLGLWLATTAATASADDSGVRLPVGEAARPLTMPKHVVSSELEFDAVFLPTYIPYAIRGRTANDFLNLTVGASAGILDDLTVRAVVLPLQLGETGPFISQSYPGTRGVSYGQYTAAIGVDFAGPGIGATYRLLDFKGIVEVGLAADATFVTLFEKGGVIFTPTVPLRLHAGSAFYFETGVSLPVIYASAGLLGMRVPLGFAWDITQRIHVGGEVAVAFPDVRSPGNNDVASVGGFAGYTLAGRRGPILDIDPFVTAFVPGTPIYTPFSLLQGGFSSFNQYTTGEMYSVGIRLRAFLYL